MSNTKEQLETKVIKHFNKRTRSFVNKCGAKGKGVSLSRGDKLWGVM
jgi:hypothetical protein